MEARCEEPSVVASLPVGELPPGDVGPPMEPDHPSWKVLSGWTDPLADRAAYRVPAGKTRVEHEGQAAVEWPESANVERALITGRPTWREYCVECRMQALQEQAGPTTDCWFIEEAMAGIVFRVQTSRWFYYFCLQGKRRLVLFRRIDDEWSELAAQDVAYEGQVVTLSVGLDADGMRARCPELGVDLHATDGALKSGKAGFRALGACRLFDLRVTMTPSQRRLNEGLAGQLVARTARLGACVPDEREVGQIDLALGRLVQASDFCVAGRVDLLWSTREGLAATTWDGRELWRLPQCASHVKVASAPVGGARRIYALVGERSRAEQVTVRGKPSRRTVADEMVAIDGATGRVEARVRLPDEPEIELLRNYDVSYETGRLVSEDPLDICVRQWRSDCGGGGRDLWAYDASLKLLWHRKVDPPYGHHNAVHLVDLDGDGRDEVMAGGTLLSPDGDVIAVHDRADEVEHITGAGHYDAVCVGFFAEDPEKDPVAFLMAGSAGVYVVDPLTGRTRAAHRTGHAQWGLPCKVRDDLPGKQILHGTRWGNMGIMTLFSGRGERLWTIQPDHIVQGSCAVQWEPQGPQLIWHNTSRDALGLYDGRGRLVKPLSEIRRLWGERTPMQVACRALRPRPEGPDLLGVGIGDTMHLFGPKT